MQETSVWFLGQEDPWRRDRLPTPIFLGFLCSSAGKESACNVGDPSTIPGLGRSPGERKGYPLQYSGLENSMDCIVHIGVAKSWTWLSDFHFTLKSRKMWTTCYVLVTYFGYCLVNKSCPALIFKKHFDIFWIVVNIISTEFANGKICELSLLLYFFP